jgi:hypothetical protein
MLASTKQTAAGARSSRSAVSVSGLLSSARNVHRPTTVVASTGTKQRSSTASAVADGSSNPWAQPGYLGAVVSSQPEDTQRTVFAGILAAIGAGTVLSCSVLGPAISAYLPSFLQGGGASGSCRTATWQLITDRT